MLYRVYFLSPEYPIIHKHTIVSEDNEYIYLRRVSDNQTAIIVKLMDKVNSVSSGWWDTEEMALSHARKNIEDRIKKLSDIEHKII